MAAAARTLPLQTSVAPTQGPAPVDRRFRIHPMNTLRGSTIGFSAAVADVCAPAPSAADLRVHLRRRAEECQWLQRARFKYGPDVHVVDISKGGVLVETPN